MVNETRQAGDETADSDECFQKQFEAIERLGNDLAQIQKRWNNRLVLEHTPLWEGYLNGRFEIVLYADWRIGSTNRLLACCIATDAAICGGNNPSRRKSGGHVEICNGKNIDGGQDEIMLIDVVQIGYGVKIKVPIFTRFYLIPNEVGDLRDGLLYRNVTSGGFKIFPFTREWEINPSVFRVSTDVTNKRSGPVVQGRPKIMNRISHNERERLCDWFDWFIGQLNAIWLSKNCYGVTGAVTDFVQVLGKGGGQVYKGLDVALGPFDL
jgi:hypothetical protein